MLFPPEWVRDQIGSFAALTQSRFQGVPDSYDYPDKNNVRKHIVLQAKKYLKLSPGSRLRLLFLPSVAAIDLYEFSREFEIDPTGSLAVEQNSFYCDHLRSWIEAADMLVGGEPLKGLRLFEGKMSRAMATMDGPFEVANLDFTSTYNREIRASLRHLFTRQLLTIPGVLFITLNEWAERVHAEERGEEYRPLSHSLRSRIYALTRGTLYCCHYLWFMDWTTENGGKMVTIAFGIHHKDDHRKTL